MTEKKPCIGFVILVWNSEKVIDKCLKSIVDLKKIIPIIVVIDNGSTDSTQLILMKYMSMYPNLMQIITYKENKGTTVSRNDGIKLLKNCNLDYYCILDSDTEISDEAFIKLISELKKNPCYGLIGPEMRSSNGIVQMSARAFPTLLEKFYKAMPSKSFQKKGEEMEKQIPPFLNMESYAVDYLMSACWLIKPEILLTTGLLDEKIFYAPEDAEFCIRVWKAGYQVAFCPSAKIVHEWQRLSKKKFVSKMNFEHVKGLIYMFKKHHYLMRTDKLKRTFKGEK